MVDLIVKAKELNELKKRNKVALTMKVNAGITVASFIVGTISLILFKFWLSSLIILLLMGLTSILIMKPELIWKFIEKLSKKDNEKKDVLLRMEEYYKEHSDRLSRLNTTLDKIKITRHKIQKDYNELKSKINHITFVASEKQKQLNSEAVNELARNLSIDNKSLNSLEKELNEIKDREQYLTDYQKSYASTVSNIRYRIDSNKREYLRKKELAEVYNEADEFLYKTGKSEADYEQTINEFEQSTALFTCQIRDHEQRLKSTVDGVKIDDEVKRLEGLDIIEKYNNKLNQME